MIKLYFYRGEKMYSKTVIVKFKGKLHSVDVPCNLNISVEECKEIAIKILKRRETKLNELHYKGIHIIT